MVHINRDNNCLVCKGSNPSKFCGRSFCPIYNKSQSMFKIKKKISKDYYFGSSPSVFVGRHGWPNVNVGILTPPGIKDDAWEYDAPKYLAESKKKIPEIVDYRSSLVNSRFKSNIWVNNSKNLELSQEVSIASKPTDVEINLLRKPNLSVKFDSDVMPMGPGAELKDAKITENTKISRKVDKVVSDIDMKSKEGLVYLFENNYDENFLSRILSMGNLGVKKKRTLVPTRWSITAVDDNLGKHILEEVRENKYDEYKVFFGGHLGNYYLIIFLPEIWSFELFEMYKPKVSWNNTDSVQYVTDYESFRGRKGYAYNTTGGYYAARLPILKYLKEQKRQASVIAIRVITDEYEVPLGVWVCREAAANSIKNKPLTFYNKDLLMKYVDLVMQKKLGVDVSKILEKSVVLKTYGQQQKLSDFF